MSKKTIAKLGKLLAVLVLTFAITSLLIVMLRRLPAVDYGSRKFLFFSIGFAAYIFIHTIFYQPLFMHVFSHELAHAIWTKIFGGKVRDISVSQEGGRVTINKSNFVINLAPYFFPLYTILFLVLSYLVKDAYAGYIIGLIGASLGFHLLLTFHSIHTAQSDLRETGYIFSVMFIFFMNLVLLCWVFSVLDPRAFQLAEVFTEFTAQTVVMLDRIGEWTSSLF